MSGYFPLFTVPDGTDFELLGDGPRGLDFLRWLLTPAGSETSARLRMQMQSSYGEFLAQSSGGHRSDNPHSAGASSSGSSLPSGDAGALRPPFGAAKRELADADGSLPPGPRRRRIGARQADRDHGVQLQRDGHGDLVSLERLRRAHSVGELDAARMRGRPQGFAEVPYVANLPESRYWCVLQCCATSALPPGLYNRWRHGAQVLVTRAGSTGADTSAVFRGFASLREVESYYAGARALPVPRVSSYAGMPEGPAE